MKKMVRISSVLMTISLLLVLPLSFQLLGTWTRRFIEIVPGYQMQNYLAPMGFASLTLICIGLVVTWTTFQEMRRSAWFVLLLVAWLFYFPVLTLPSYPANWRATLEGVATSEFARATVFHYLGFVLMILALLLPVKGFFWKGKVAN